MRLTKMIHNNMTQKHDPLNCFIKIRLKKIHNNETHKKYPQKWYSQKIHKNKTHQNDSKHDRNKNIIYSFKLKKSFKMMIKF